MPKNLHKIVSHSINLQKVWDEAHIFFFDPKDSIEDFIKRLDEYLPEVVFTKSDIDLYKVDIEKWIEEKPIQDFAKEFLKKVKKETWAYPYKNAWELWEIILTIFQRYQLWAIKVVSKMWNRDSVTFNILWRDTSFVCKNTDWNVCMLVGESKLSVNTKKEDWTYDNNSLKDGLADAHDDLKSFYENPDYLNHEVNLARKWMVHEMTPENVELYKEYFIKNSPKHSALIYKNVIFVWYTHNEYLKFQSWKYSKEEYITWLLLHVQDSFNTQKINTRIGAIDKNTIYFLLPFECVEKARGTFVEYNWLGYE